MDDNEPEHPIPSHYPNSEPEDEDDDNDNYDYEGKALIITVVILGTIICMVIIRALYKRFCKRSHHTSAPLSNIQDNRYVYSNPAYQPTQPIFCPQTTPSAQSVSSLPPAYRQHMFLPTVPGIQTAPHVGSTVAGERAEHSHELAVVPRRNSQSSNESSLLDNHQYMFDQFDISLRDLFIPTERSIKKIVSNKLVVIAAHLVDHHGYTLVLDNMGISLHIPPGAIQEGEKQMVSLVLNWDLTDNPGMTDNQALVSPVVYCGPHGLILRETCTLTYRHCAYDAGDIKVMMSDTELTEGKNWTPLCDAREEMGQCVVTQEECKIRLDHFSLFTSIQDRPATSPGKKWLQLAVFTCPLQAQLDHFQVRIYFLNKTPCALEWAIQNEAALGTRKCCPEKIFLFNGTGEDMVLSLAYLSEQWESIDGNIDLRTPFLSIWHGHCPYVAMCFKRQRTLARRAEEINIHFLAQQDGQDNQQERLIIHMTEDRTASPRDNAYCCNNPQHGPSTVRVTVQDHIGTAVDVEIRQSDDNRNQQTADCVNLEIFPEDLKRELIDLLDPPDQLGNDWRDLASKLALDHVIPFLEFNSTSPTLLLLQNMEKTGVTLARLYEILESMGRHDASRSARHHCLESGVYIQEPVAGAWLGGAANIREMEGYMSPEGRAWLGEGANIREMEGYIYPEGRAWSESGVCQTTANIPPVVGSGRDGEEHHDSVEAIT